MMIRFKKDDGTEFSGWIESTIGKECIVNPKTNELEDEFLYIDLESVTNGVLKLKEKIKKTNAPSRAQRVLSVGDVLFQSVRPYQKNHFHFVKKFELQTVASTGYAQLRMKDGDNRFLFQFLFTEKFNNDIDKNCTGSNYPAINSNDLSKIKIKFPKDKNEQKKIADFLSEVDNMISIQEQQLAALEEQKKGVMQKIFSQEVRFKKDDGTNFPEWIESTIGKECIVNPKTNELEDEFLYIDLESVTNGVLELKEKIKKINAPSRAQRVLSIGDVLFQSVRPYQKNHFHFVKEFELQTVASTGYAQLRMKDGDNRFLFQFLFTEKFNNDIDKNCTGSNYPAINSNDLSKIKIRFPKDKNEQKKIANFLSEYDKAIEIKRNKLEAWRILKKGLLQQMF